MNHFKSFTVTGAYVFPVAQFKRKTCWLGKLKKTNDNNSDR